MRRMTVMAQRKRFIGLGFPGKVNTLSKQLINSMVTLGTGLSDVVAVHTGSGVTTGQFTMSSMTVSTHSGNHQTTLQKPLAMNAFDIVFQNLALLGREPGRYFAPFPMTLSTKFRYMSGIGR